MFNDFFLRAGWVMWVYLFLGFILVYAFFRLIIICVISRRKIIRFIKDERTKNEEGINIQIINQKSVFFLWLTILKFIGILLPAIFVLRIVLGSIISFDVLALTGAFEVSFFASGISQVLIGWAIGLVIAVFCWINYFIFSAILERRILTLERIKAEIKLEDAKVVDEKELS